MSKDGYSFSLADSTVAELLIQVRSGRIPIVGYNKMIDLLKTFLNKDLPILPGKRDLEVIIGLHQLREGLEEISYLSQHGWYQMLMPDREYAHFGPSLEKTCKEERDNWADFIRSFAETAFCYGIDIANSQPKVVADFLVGKVSEHISSDTYIEPSIAVRRHLEIRYRIRQVVRSLQKKSRITL
ncbi:hypothetical protein A9Q75_07195 [Colwellia psychrerythraea]|uniref:Uncharacterized protein n=1 Tax=Colwellia psychrerythraea TaxID=28229 RepID=A0A1Y5EKS5_COLPS|nr:hypothetical protein A9Q75_07195 [Colwellia psychrerythraea]